MYSRLETVKGQGGYVFRRNLCFALRNIVKQLRNYFNEDLQSHFASEQTLDSDLVRLRIPPTLLLVIALVKLSQSLMH